MQEPRREAGKVEGFLEAVAGAREVVAGPRRVEAGIDAAEDHAQSRRQDVV